MALDQLSFSPEQLRDFVLGEMDEAGIPLTATAGVNWVAVASALSEADKWERTLAAPNVAPGLARRINTIVEQRTDATPSEPITLWLKVGPGDTDWVNFGGGEDDHLVKASNSDTTAPGSLFRKTIDSATITRTLVTDPTDGNIQKVQLNAVASNPAIEGTKLWPAKTTNPLVRSSAYCLMKHSQGYGLGWSQWTRVDSEYGPYSFRENGLDTCVGYGTGLDPLPLPAGTRVLVRESGGYGGSGATGVGDGIYEVVVAEDAANGVHGVIRRTTDNNDSIGLRAGMVVQITGGSAVAYNGNWLQVANTGTIDPNSTAISWNVLTSFSPTVEYPLLTQAGVVANAPLDQYVNGLVENPLADTWIPIPIDHEAATVFESDPSLDLQYMASGIATFGVAAFASEAREDPQAMNQIKAVESLYRPSNPPGEKLIGVLATGISELFVGDNFTHNLEFQGAFTALAWQPGDVIVVQYFFRTQSDIIGSAGLSVYRPETFIRHPWQIPGGASGTTDHSALINRDRKVTNAQSWREHPHDSIGPSGRIHVLSSEVTVADGLLTMPADSNVAEVVSASNVILQGIAKADWLTGDEIRILFTVSGEEPKVTVLGSQDLGAASATHGALLLQDLAAVQNAGQMDFPGACTEVRFRLLSDGMWKWTGAI